MACSIGGYFWHPLVNKVAAEYTNCLLESGDVKKAVKYVEEAYSSCGIDFVDPEDVDKAELAFYVGKIYNADKEFEYAERALRATLVWYERVHGVDHTLTGQCLDQLGIALMGQNKLGDETKAVLHRALDIFLLNLGPDAQLVGAANESLGVFYEMRGEIVQARRFFKEALRIYTKVLGPEHPNTVNVKTNLLRVKAVISAPI